MKNVVDDFIGYFIIMGLKSTWIDMVILYLLFAVMEMLLIVIFVGGIS